MNEEGVPLGPGLDRHQRFGRGAPAPDQFPYVFIIEAGQAYPSGHTGAIIRKLPDGDRLLGDGRTWPNWPVLTGFPSRSLIVLALAPQAP